MEKILDGITEMIGDKVGKPCIHSFGDMDVAEFMYCENKEWCKENCHNADNKTCWRRFFKSLNEKEKIAEAAEKLETDWIIHAVYDLDPIDIHSHGMEKYGIKNFNIECTNPQLIYHCGRLINDVARAMISGEKYNIDETHYVFNGVGTTEMLYAFTMTEDRRDNGNGIEDVYLIKCLNDKEVYYPFVNHSYKYNYETERWEMK